MKLSSIIAYVKGTFLDGAGQPSALRIIVVPVSYAAVGAVLGMAAVCAVYPDDVIALHEVCKWSAYALGLCMAGKVGQSFSEK